MRALLATLWFVVSINAAPDLILRNGLIYDGTGRAPFKGDIAIANGRIIAVDAHDVLPLRELTMLNAVERQQRTSPLLALLDDMEFSAVDGEDALDPDDMTAQWKSDLLMKVASLLVRVQGKH